MNLIKYYPGREFNEGRWWGEINFEIQKETSLGRAGGWSLKSNYAPDIFYLYAHVCVAEL